MARLDHKSIRTERNIHVTTSIPPKFHRLALEKNLKWNECLIKGIQELAYNYEDEQERGVKVLKETKDAQISKLQRANYQLQQALLNMEGSKDE